MVSGWFSLTYLLLSGSPWTTAWQRWSPAPGTRSRRTAMSEPKAIFRNWGSEVLRHRRERRALAADQSREAAREPYDLERIATCACSGYFHTGYALDPFVFTPELRFKD